MRSWRVRENVIPEGANGSDARGVTVTRLASARYAIESKVVLQATVFAVGEAHRIGECGGD